MSNARFMVLLLLLLLLLLLSLFMVLFVYDSLGTTEWNWNRGLYDKYVHVALFCHNHQIQQCYENILILL